MPADGINRTPESGRKSGSSRASGCANDLAELEYEVITVGPFRNADGAGGYLSPISPHIDAKNGPLVHVQANDQVSPEDAAVRDRIAITGRAARVAHL